MQKISTLFKKDPSDLGRVIDEIDPENAWALTEGVPTRKFDGTACAIINGELYKRYDAKHGKPAPVGGIPCQGPDPITGHWPHWVLCKDDNPADKFAIEGFKNLIRDTFGDSSWEGTYELVGPKVQKNPEGYTKHYLVKHGAEVLSGFELTFDGIREYLASPENNIEGIVFHHPDGRMCKIRKKDFGFNRIKTPSIETVEPPY